MARVHNGFIETNPVKIMYPELLVPVENRLTKGKMDYTATFLIPKSDKETLDAFKQAIANAKNYGLQRGFRIPENSTLKFYDGDGTKSDGKPHHEVYHGHWFYYAKANADKKPTVLIDDKENKLVREAESDDIYSGVIGKVCLNVYAYDNVQKGISASLQQILITDKGERIGGNPFAITSYEKIRPNNLPQEPSIPGAAFNQPFNNQPMQNQPMQNQPNNFFGSPMADQGAKNVSFNLNDDDLPF